MRRGIAGDHRQIARLVGVVEAEAQPEAVGEREPVVEDVARVDRARGFGVGVFAGDQMPTVRRDDQPDMVGPRLDAAVEDRLRSALYWRSSASNDTSSA